IAERAQNNDKFFVNDINWLSAEFGLSKWSDPKHWYLYKYICGPSAIPTLAFSIRNIVKALLGKNKKAVSVDLDNTLWGGIVGDDGPEGIKIGPEGPIGQAHLGLQQYLKDLRSIGVVLCVNSKNDMENAIAGLNHPSGVLKPDDFALIKANWEPKSDNLLNTASELGLLPESFVFIDDNPAERALVKAQGGGALAPDLTDPEKYVIELDRLGLFEATTLSKEDMRRSLLYKEEAKRTELRKSSGSYEEFLASLDMRSNISPINPMTAQRSTELVNKSNQFNLTTLRCSQARMDEWSKSDTHLALSADLEDKIGNHGLVSVVVGEFKDHDFHVLIWVMSCRVLKRRLEEAVLDKLVDLCKEKGAKAIIGYFYPTKKNSMVKEFYPSMGFSLQSEDEEKNTAWVLDVSSHVSKAPPIRAAGGESGCN
ncbi:MAG: HAD-IIIC family phosphatase, partial [Clostridiales bacterium]|nr:HAD-IIIC family phosphatase [Clostridiales bacterium]